MRAGSPARHRARGSGAAPGAAGYSLVMVVMIITVLNIMVAMALPLWSGMIRRDKEEELISRGLQYAEAIRVFQRRFGRLPVQLDELVKVEPRSIRRLWEDPITGKQDWIPIFEGAPPGAGRIDPVTGQPVPPEVTGPENSPGSEDGETPPQAVGPIRGVRSRATGEGFLIFLDQASYASWEFRSDIFARFRAAPSENGIPRISALTIGRPFRFLLPGSAPQPPGGLQPSGSGEKPTPRPTLRSRPKEPPPAGGD